MSYNSLVFSVRQELSKTKHGRDLLGSWSDAKIKQELNEPCFFGVKNAIVLKENAVRHFERLASFRK